MKSRGVRCSQRKLASLIPQLGRATYGTRVSTGCAAGLTDQEITDLFRLLGLAPVQRSGPLTEAALVRALGTGRPVAVAFKWGHMCLIYGREKEKYLIYDPLGPATGALTLAEIRDYGQGDHNWQTSWTGL